MRLAIRVDASTEMGTGHFMRCMTLAAEFRSRGAKICFISWDLPEHLANFLMAEGYEFAALDGNRTTRESHTNQEVDAKSTIQALLGCEWDWLVVDHYSLDIEWEILIRPYVQKLMVIDDLANRLHDCDLLLDQNYYANSESRYRELISDNCVCLLGPQFALLRSEFSDALGKFKIRSLGVRRLLIFFGGTDPTNETRKALDALKLLACPEMLADVIVGTGNPHKNQIREMCEQISNVKYHCQVSNMAELIGAADLAIGAGGAVTWERCLLGLPSLTLVLAENQFQTTLDLERFGATILLGWAHEITSCDLANSIEALIQNEKLLHHLSERAVSLMKDWAGASAVVDAMECC
ncbi:UDP-2,4-diacetamido-2,4,6-trideoxy-beta-L-altropyranose hydrolase [Oxalicibacterium solurbis]|uniref:UDP-2,4-diacetamido-2,4,6-trideoxy-beta-L-altropyranose hydrolase n=1 Tax=Oxalicibacterium solurbis TaxID=69280 RepID=A0A8J3AVL8_9BURK|nr:UDP-2,4-diacetamido-2,4,6-trideoxy-beta-L-altropyranose hydrolase [Oxalicibacterium solurbis]GGI54429.1 UDP-2,4-diacetamido-2,4,6-trideoxy-beta-L-altropyranose hydrolase [Oxalicibacterium solurbis]